MTSQRKCYRLMLDANCAYNRSNLKISFLQQLERLPKDGEYSTQTMEAWKGGIVNRFGTHVAMASSHGALVQTLASMDARSEESSDCLDSSLCLNFGWLATANASFCSGTSRCDNSTRSS